MLSVIFLFFQGFLLLLLENMKQSVRQRIRLTKIQNNSGVFCWEFGWIFGFGKVMAKKMKRSDFKERSGLKQRGICQNANVETRV
jgi:hypothetical protein